MLKQQEVREKLLDRTGRETQASVAKKIGVPTSVISKFKNGQELWDDTLVALNDYLDGVNK